MSLSPFKKAVCILLGLFVVVVAVEKIDSLSSDSVAISGFSELIGLFQNQESKNEDRIEENASESISTNLSSATIESITASNFSEKLSDLFGLSFNAFNSDLPKGFEEEIIKTSGYQECFVSESKTLIGLLSDASAEDSFEQIKQNLNEHGWVCIESGVNQIATFQKSSGVYRWLFIQVQDMSDQSLIAITLDLASIKS